MLEKSADALALEVYARSIMRDYATHLEWWIVALSIFDKSFFNAASPIINRSPEGLPVNDFLDPVASALYEGVKSYHRITGSSFANGMNYAILATCLQTFASQGQLIAAGEVNAAIQNLAER